MKHKLDAEQVRKARPRKESYKLWDGRGLFLLVTPTGGKWWRFKYRWMGREKLLSMGVYPDTGLSLAREKHQRARTLLARNIDPSRSRKLKKTEALTHNQDF